MLEGTSNGMGVYESNYFLNHPTVAASGFVGRRFSSESVDLYQCSISMSELRR